jgi:AAA domain
MNSSNQMIDLTRCFVSGEPTEYQYLQVIDSNLPPTYTALGGPKPITEITLLEAAGEKPDQSEVVRGFMDFPTHPPADDVLAGDGQFRVADIHMWNAPAGQGKSVGASQKTMAWSLGLPYFGIYPTRPLKIIHFCGEDDASTIGQCREGFLLHSEVITGRQLTSADLKPLDEMVRTDFSREFTGNAFLLRLDAMLTEEHADVILINPLLSFIGGPIVETVSDFLRKGLGPILQRHRCAALISHHTCKLNKDSWENMDFTYSGIGGGEIANIPRSVFTLAPTKVEGLLILHVSKRKTVGWKDDEGKFTDHAYFKRTDDPKRPAWLPVTHGEAAELMEAVNSSSGGRNKKATIEHVMEALTVGAMTRQALIETVIKNCRCGLSTAKTAISNAQLGSVSTFTEKDSKTGRSILFFCLPEHRGQWVKTELTS